MPGSRLVLNGTLTIITNRCIRRMTLAYKYFLMFDDRELHWGKLLEFLGVGILENFQTSLSWSVGCIFGD
jgi:hypothetical protein